MRLVTRGDGGDLLLGPFIGRVGGGVVVFGGVGDGGAVVFDGRGFTTSNRTIIPGLRFVPKLWIKYWLRDGAVDPTL